MSERLPRGFWTASRLMMLESWIARGESYARMAAKLDCTRKQLYAAVHNHRVQARDLLDVRDD